MLDEVRAVAARAFYAGLPMLAISLFDVADQFEVYPVTADRSDLPASPAGER